MPRQTYTDNQDQKKANTSIAVIEWTGMAASQDQHGGDAGKSRYQVNCFALHPGELRVRQGIQQVTFST